MREKILKVKDFVEQGRGNSLTEAFKDFIFIIKQKNKGFTYVKYSPRVDSKFFYMMLKTKLDGDLAVVAREIYIELYTLGTNSGLNGLYFHDFTLIPENNGSYNSMGIMAHIKRIDK